ncbi:DNA translocase FtsK [Flavobacterium sp. NKUCC04_CG]|uniref:DNA translocase FtsK n=1 Tax=Flavobacterium sp. NKUCC04_CG TaxID=2842121 RepID=UPI001C5B82FD|nr:DNA translocase FtsK [Flavobacterium sp. NKUCC04_CG]MBW3518642.1 DNA translocase FtsK [Flavobacterium sp. NKUCC04_CG]
MAKTKNETTKKKSNKTTPEQPMPNTSVMNNSKFIISVILIISAVALLLSFISYFITGYYDQSNVDLLSERNEVVYNWLGKIGAYLSHFFIYEGFGLASFIFVKILIYAGLFLFFGIAASRFKKILFWDLFSIIIASVILGFFWSSNPLLGGVIGFEINMFLQDYLGKTGTILLLIFSFVVFIIFRLKVSPTGLRDKIQDFSIKKESDSIAETVLDNENDGSQPEVESKNSFSISEEKPTPSVAPKTTQNQPKSISLDVDHKGFKPTIEHSSEIDFNKNQATKSDMQVSPAEMDKELLIEAVQEEATVEENLAAKLVQDFGVFDPTLELSNYQFPTIELLKDYGTGGITINQAELEENKNRIVETLRNYKIDIAQIKATVGPTVTLYEIVPEAGVRISKIKNLEDDIALSLSALGIRIIAPIPGKGTIGIEVPNKNPSMVSMRSVVASPKFQNAEMELPIALGKTISNETFVVDLAKMPHLLMAGATGQGKSVGLNAVLTSLLYKKHPAEVKFVLVDPKKVELTLFNKIERHYLAKLPDSGDAIITDNTKVINTLNSLCVEMDNRYNLLKDAMVRNIKEYNDKFKQRRLNPENGHRFLPYIVLVVDEFADLIMTAGKEVETPIARLAQLARAIGIHLIIATQRPSVNVITGIIKANFPARIAFRVTSKIDSRTILDSQGADQLIGRGDMLFTHGNELVRVQCAFVDTPEVERVTDFIGSQKAYADAYLLPEFFGEESGTSLDIDISDRDTLFREAAEIIVVAQQGSASLLQRKLKLGYNRAGRIIDQLEAAGIVGPFEGSKARSVAISDLAALDNFFKDEQN